MGPRQELHQYLFRRPCRRPWLGNMVEKSGGFQKTKFEFTQYFQTAIFISCLQYCIITFKTKHEHLKLEGTFVFWISSINLELHTLDFGLSFFFFKTLHSTPGEPSILHVLPSVVQLAFEVENRVIPFCSVNSIWDSWCSGATCCTVYIALSTRRGSKGPEGPPAFIHSVFSFLG